MGWELLPIHSQTCVHQLEVHRLTRLLCLLYFQRHRCQLWGLLDLVKASEASSFASTGTDSDRRPSLDVGSSTSADRRLSQSSASGASPKSSAVDLVTLMKATTRTIRSVRNYLLALPAEALPGGLAASAPQRIPSETRPKDQFRRQSSFAHLPRVNLGSSDGTTSVGRGTGPDGSPRRKPILGIGMGPPPSRRGSADVVPEDPLVLVRRSALDVLGMLRELEERTRLPPDDPAYETSEAGGHLLLGSSLTSRPGSVSAGSDHETLATSPPGSLAVGMPGVSSPTQELQRRFSQQSSFSSNGAGEREMLTALDMEAGSEVGEAASLAGGYLYRTDVPLAALERERGTVRAYLETVDRVLSATGTRTRSRRARKSGTTAAMDRRSASEVPTGLVHASGSSTPSRPGSLMMNDVFGSGSAAAPSIRVGQGDELGRLAEEDESSAGMGEVEEEEEMEEEDRDLPAWAMREEYPGGEVGELCAAILGVLGRVV